jgi:DNA-binding transcriptional MerR regulator
VTGLKTAAMAEPNIAALPAKLYFRIGEVAGLVGVEPHVLRYWEREFRAIRPAKSARGQRVYSRRDVENLMRVRELLYKEGFTIAGAKKKLHRPASRLEPDPLVEPCDTDSSPEAGETDSSPEAGETDSSPEAGETERARATETATMGGAPIPSASRAREQLLAIREEIEAFLAELVPLGRARE